MAIGCVVNGLGEARETNIGFTAAPTGATNQPHSRRAGFR
jgi:4-hydroxy-3-methylbut-2-en-1-yl diphosphate synthase IspG/GcpE